MDELLLNDININAKLIRDIAPSLYQAIDLYRRQLHDLSDYDFDVFSKSLAHNSNTSEKTQKTQVKNSPLLDKLFTIGILAVLSKTSQKALSIYQKMVSNNNPDNYDWTENYLISQLQVAICLFAKNSEIKRNSLVSKFRSQEQGVKIVEQTWRPRYYEENFGSIVDLLSYYSKRQHELKAHSNPTKLTPTEAAGKFTSWITHGSTISNMIKAVPEFDKHDPIKAAMFNLIQAHHGLYDGFLIDDRILEVINFSKAISDETSIFINELRVCFWS